LFQRCSFGDEFSSSQLAPLAITEKAMLFELYYNLVKLYRIREFGVLSMMKPMLSFLYSISSTQTAVINRTTIIFPAPILSKRTSIFTIAILLVLTFGVYHESDAYAQDAVVTAAPAGDDSPAEEKNDSSEKAAAQKSKTAVKTVAAKVEPFKVSVTLDAIVDSDNYQTVTLRSQSLKELKLESFAQHGQRVSKGQQVLKLESDPWHRALQSAQQALASADLELQQARKQAETINEVVRLENHSAELAAKQAKEDFEHFLKQGRDQQIESQEQSLKSAERSLENAREEYEQLKKMYQADQITEETEEIVLRRARFDVERAEYGLKVTQNRVQRFLDVEITRVENNLKNAVDKTQLDLQRSQLGVEQRVQSTRLQAAKAEMAAEMARREVAKLQEDRQWLEIAASFPGAVFWGAADRGQWKGASAVEELMYVGNNVPPNRPLMTIVGTDNLFVHCKVPERWSRAVQSGSTGELELTAIKGKRISVQCEQVGGLPVEPGQYRAIFRFDRKAQSQELNPLMTGKINLVVYEKENALTLPVEAVRRDSSGDYVMLAKADDSSPKRQDVVVGWSDEKRVEIIQGLREDENVVLP
jgi:HlyD family secretion protein